MAEARLDAVKKDAGVAAELRTQEPRRAAAKWRLARVVDAIAATLS